MRILFYILALSFCVACSSEKQGEKWQKERSDVVDVKDRVKEIRIDTPLIGSIADPYVYDKYLIIADFKSVDKMVHIFDKNTFEYLVSVGNRGQGPDEIISLGSIAWNPENRELYVTAHGQQKIYSYQMDSLLRDPLCSPRVKLRSDLSRYFPNDYYYVNDTLSYGSFVQTTSTPFKQTSGRFNFKTGEVKLTDYTHPADKKKRVVVGVSLEHNTLVECNGRYDLISLYDLNGNLRCNVYGPNWDESGDRKEHFGDVVICGDKIIASYVGGDWINNDGARLFHVFSITGDYLKTLYVGRPILGCCYDEENNRLIFNMDSSIQFGYLELDGLV